MQAITSYRCTSLAESTVKTEIDNIVALANSMRAKIANAEATSAEAEVKHHFSDGVYVREIMMPKDMLVVGKIHKTRHMNIISQGRCTVVTPLRKLEITAPFTFESIEGEQKVVYMHEDVIWTTVHVTKETDLAKIEEHCISTEYDESLIAKLVHKVGELI